MNPVCTMYIHKLSIDILIMLKNELVSLVVCCWTSNSKKIYLILRRHHWWWWDAKFIPMLCFWARKDFYRATSTVIHGLGFCGFIWRTAPDNHLNDEQEVWGPILTRIPLGLKVYDAIKHKYWKLRHYYYRDRCSSHWQRNENVKAVTYLTSSRSYQKVRRLMQWIGLSSVRLSCTLFKFSSTGPVWTKLSTIWWREFKFFRWRVSRPFSRVDNNKNTLKIF